MKLWQFFLTLGSAVGITYVMPALLAYFLHRNGVKYPWNLVTVLLAMVAFVALLLLLCLQEERRNRERSEGEK